MNWLSHRRVGGGIVLTLVMVAGFFSATALSGRAPAATTWAATDAGGAVQLPRPDVAAIIFVHARNLIADGVGARMSETSQSIRPSLQPSVLHWILRLSPSPASRLTA